MFALAAVRSSRPLAVVASLLAIAGCSDRTAVRTIDLAPCRLESDTGLASVRADCGVLSVPENRAEPQGKTLDLRIAVVPAASREPAGEPLFVLAGGPGQAATEFYAAYAPAFGRVQRTRDIVLVDQRGTGGSNPLRCPAPDESDLLAVETFDPEQLRTRAAECLAQLAGDPRFYTTSVAVDDLDAVREALGYERIDLYGVSYGTRVAQHYLRRYPAHVRAMVLDGSVPPQLILGPDTAPEAQRALEGILGRCEIDPRCHSAFPDLEDTFTSLLDRLREQPVTLSLADPTTADTVEFDFGIEAFGAAVRLLSYSDETAALLPLLLHTAGAEGRFEPLAAQYLMVARRLGGQLAEGMHNAVVCTEDVPFIDIDAATAPAITDTYLGTLQVQGLEAICSVWPRGVLDEDLHAPLAIEVPLLLLSGEFDPITSPGYAEQILAQAKDALHVIQRGHAHGQLGSRCISGLIAEFLATAAPDALDPGCALDAEPAAFFLDFTGAAP